MPLRVLVIDDRAENVFLLSRFLSPLNCQVRTCVDSRCARELASSFRPELVVLDHEMPGMDGLAVARELRKLPLSPLWIVSWSGAHDNELKRLYRAIECDLFLDKPARGCDIAQLISNVRCRRQALSCGRSSSPASGGPPTQ